ncbi:MAG TPA: DUF4160 domain-containing protein [Chromatiales bacterium]|nr:DUF4160 domain-containing protein [Chromatiales bacterium]
MPVISRFLGVVIAMYYADHEPPHFHARYGGREALIEIASGAVIAGDLPPRVLGLVQEWRLLHRGELKRNWDRARRREPLVPVPPLE